MLVGQLPVKQNYKYLQNSTGPRTSDGNMGKRPKLRQKDKHKWIKDNLKVATWNVRGMVNKEENLVNFI